MIAEGGFWGVSVASFRMTDHCNNMQRLIFMIRQYLSSESDVMECSSNGVFEVERAVREFHLYDPECDVNDEFLREMLCVEALRKGMALHFGKEI